MKLDPNVDDWFEIEYKNGKPVIALSDVTLDREELVALINVLDNSSSLKKPGTKFRWDDEPFITINEYTGRRALLMDTDDKPNRLYAVSLLDGGVVFWDIDEVNTFSVEFIIEQ